MADTSPAMYDKRANRGKGLTATTRQSGVSVCTNMAAQDQTCQYAIVSNLQDLWWYKTLFVEMQWT